LRSLPTNPGILLLRGSSPNLRPTEVVGSIKWRVGLIQPLACRPL
jgi:hypothetical protein